MNPIERSYRLTILSNAILGIVFGALFPVYASWIVMIQFDLPFTMAGLSSAHERNILLYIIDSAPLFLGLFAALSGFNQAKLEKARLLLEEQVLFDELTRVHNRQFGQIKLREMIEQAEKKEIQHRIALFFIDIDNFKSINGNIGHASGDQLLISVATHLKKSAVPGEIVSRLGGDEFMIIAPINTENDIPPLAERYIKACQHDFMIDEKAFLITISMGIAIYPDHAKSMDTLFQYAGMALYENKSIHEAPYEIFDQKMMRIVQRTFLIEKELEFAIERNEFVLYYQPIIHLKTQAIVGAEALIRWKNEALGFISPEHFIPIAERSNVIVHIGNWVLQEACRQNKAWQAAGLKPIIVSVNASAQHLGRLHFYDSVIQALTDSGLDRQFLKLEVTETSSMKNIDLVAIVFDRLNKQGIQFSIDDFGTGYSSLSKLAALPLNDLKIDKSFVSGIGSDRGRTHLAIVETIIAMAKKLGLRVVAEGVEDWEQLEILQYLDCDYGQGYLFSRPLPADEFAEFLAKQDELITPLH